MPIALLQFQGDEQDASQQCRDFIARTEDLSLSDPGDCSRVPFDGPELVLIDPSIWANVVAVVIRSKRMFEE